MKIFILSILIIFTGIQSVVAKSYSADELLVESHKLVNELNAKFKNHHVELKEIFTECMFGTDEPVGGVHFIFYCRKDIEFFAHLDHTKKPLASLLTIFAHEYSHTLLDWDESLEATEMVEHFLFDEVAPKIYADLYGNQSIMEQLRRFGLSVTPPIQQGDLPDNFFFEMLIVAFLTNVEHSNVDSLAIKLMMLTGHTFNADVMDLLAPMYNIKLTPTIKKMLKERNLTMAKSAREGLNRWDSYNCINKGRHLVDSNLVLKSYFINHGTTGIVKKINTECTTQKVVGGFFNWLDDYIPTKLAI